MVEAAVIGCGFQGKLHLETLARLGVEIVGICDVSVERLEEARAEFGVTNCFTDYQVLLAECRPNLVSVCTMPNTHRDLCTAALNAGADVLCEKPLALNAPDATEIVAAAHATGKNLFVGFNMRFTDSALTVKHLIEEGRLGLPVCARGYMLADDVPWWGPHYIRELSGGGALAATAVHMLDLVWWLVGRPRPVTATASMATLFPKKRGASAAGARQSRTLQHRGHNVRPRPVRERLLDVYRGVMDLEQARLELRVRPYRGQSSGPFRPPRDHRGSRR